MDNLFTKAVSLTDIHFGKKSNSPIHNQDCLDFIDWFIEEAKTWGAETCFMLGDWHDNRNAIAVSTLNYSLEGMQKLNDAFKIVHWVPGNHDLLYRNKRDVSSVEFGRMFQNLNIIRDPFTGGGVTILPWLVNDEPKAMKGLKSRYVFGHLELPGFMMNAKVPMPAHGGAVTADDFTGNEYVFSGHFHFRQSIRNVVYTGNVFPFDFADTWDNDRGMMFLEYGKEPFFKAWPDQPLFRNFKLSQLLNEPDKYLTNKLTARVTLDIDISYEEAQVVKDEYMKGTGVRRMELVHQPRQQEEQNFTGEVVFQSVDQIVTEGLLDVKSKGLDPAKLVEIYKALPNL